MLDYDRWVKRAKAFVVGLPGFAGLAPLAEDSDEMSVCASVARPLTPVERDALEATMSVSFTPSLGRFLTTASSKCHLYYHWAVPDSKSQSIYDLLGSEVSGEVNLCNASEMPRYRKACQWASQNVGWIGDRAQEQATGANALPILAIRDGCYLALDLTDNANEPPVIHLGSPEGHFKVARNFDEFLWHWEGLCYIGPEGWTMTEFLDENHYLDAYTEKAQRVREFFGVSNWT